jgi:hypothetical protein
MVKMEPLEQGCFVTDDDKRVLVDLAVGNVCAKRWALKCLGRRRLAFLHQVMQNASSAVKLGVSSEEVAAIKAIPEEELTETDYSNYRHDLAVTDIRILFHSLGYTYWLSERVLAKRNDLRWLPDGMIFNRNEYIAVECESSQKSKRRYREIFYHYELNSRVHKVLYIVSTPELVQKLLREASTCSKLHFVSLENLGNDLLKAKLETKGTSSTLHDLLESSE